MSQMPPGQQPPNQNVFGDSPQSLPPNQMLPRKSGGKSNWVIVGIVLAVVAVMSICVCGILGALMLPAIQAAREAATRTASAHSMKQIGLGLHNYHDTFKQFPPSYTVDEEGNPRHSWRTAILPFNEHVGVYEQIDWNQPWNEGSNAALNSTVIPFLSSIRDAESPPTNTSYLAIVDQEAGFVPGEATVLRDMLDGTSNTIAVIEVLNSGINWMEPRDITIDKAVETIKSSDKPVNVLFMDGHVQAIPAEIDENTLRGLMTRQGKEEIFDF